MGLLVEGDAVEEKGVGRARVSSERFAGRYGGK
jgi:hypothetical protein